MKISKLASTVILTTIFANIFLFGLIFLIYTNADSKTLITLKDSLSTVSGFFGGIATLVAAYIASRLFNRWQDQHNKQVNSDFIMKFYDSLFEMKATAISTIGYFKDYLNLKTPTERTSQLNNLINHNKNLCYLIDYSSQKLSDLAFILDEKDYNENFKPKIEQLYTKLMILNSYFKIYIHKKKSNQYSPACEKLLEELPELEADLYNHYRSFMVELKRYYRA